ncbi:hypothetical protein [Nitrosococcus wardiae]|uniref:hypothetical protein n=1 Tax=Nitrosococcus wardiae TaxID=1814290 RepID=UPI001F1081C2|nr:hypothetical protein [Nitrosococcus wardiae]
MVWLLILAFLVLFLIPPRYRLQVLGSFILLTLIGFLLSQPGEKRLEEFRNLVSIEQVKFIDIELQRSPGVGQKLVGKVLNHSPSYALTGLGVQLIIKDCIGSDDTSEEDCIVLEDVQIHLPLFVPPQEEGKFEKRLYLRELHIQGYKQWEYTVLYTETKQREFWEKIPFFQD